MSEQLKLAVTFLSDYTIHIVLFIVGALGASQEPSISSSELTKRQRIFAISMGGVTSIVFTLVSVWLVDLIFDTKVPENAYPAIGYFLGHLGLGKISDLTLTWSKRKTK